MATTRDSSISGTDQANRGWPRRFRWTRAEFYRLGKLGFFEDRRVELTDGEIREMTVNPPHCTGISLAALALRSAFGPDYFVRSQGVLDLGRRQQPQPDLAVVLGSPRDYAQAHPTTAALVVEVSDTTIRYDRQFKTHLYARAGIADYWIVNLGERQLEIYRSPGPDPDRKGRFRYADVAIVPADGHASPLARPEALIAVADLLP